MATSSVRNHPNFAVICSFLQRYGEQLRLPDLTIPELEEVLEETNSVGHGLKELIIALMKRVVNSIKPDRWEKHLIKLIDNYHSPIDAWELESLGFSLCKLETKLSILKYLCETQFDDNPKFKNLVNKENPEEQKLKPIGRDKLGLVYWFQKDHECNIRIYREEQDDIDETTWQTVGRNREDLVNLISDLKVSQSMKLPPDSLESSRSGTPVVFTNGEAIVTKVGTVDVEVDGKKDNEGEKNDSETKQNQEKEENQTKTIENHKSGKYEEPISPKCDSDVRSVGKDNKCEVNEELTRGTERREKVLANDGATGYNVVTPKNSDNAIGNSKHLVSPMGESSTVENWSEVHDQNKIKVKTEDDDTSSSEKLVIDEKEEGKTVGQEKFETKEEKCEIKEETKEEKCETKAPTKEEKCEIKEETKEEKCETKAPTKEEKCETKEEKYEIKKETKEEKCKTKKETKEEKCETTEERKEEKCETKEEKCETKEEKYEIKKETKEEKCETKEGTKEEKCETTEEAKEEKCETKKEAKEEKCETKEETKKEKCETKEETKKEKCETKEETKEEKCETKEEKLKTKDDTHGVGGANPTSTLEDQDASKERVKENKENNIDNESKRKETKEDIDGVDSTASPGVQQNIPTVASCKNMEKGALKYDNCEKEDGEKWKTLPKEGNEGDKCETKTETANRDKCQNSKNEHVKNENQIMEKNAEETQVTSEENGFKQDSKMETDGPTKCCESIKDQVSNVGTDGEVEKHKPIKETAANAKEGIVEESESCNDKKKECNSEEVKDPTSNVVKTGKKNKERRKKTTKDVKCRSEQDGVTEVRWSRRLRERKPPPPKEEVIEKPKKPQKLEKTTDVHHGKQKERKKKKQEKEENVKEEPYEEEEEEIESEEKDNSSDEDFTLKSKNSTNDATTTTPIAVKKARTATSNKKSRHSKKIEPELSDEPCIKCGNYNHPDQILLCDSCDAGYHTACLRPPLMFVPDGEWFCPACEHVALLKNLEVTLEVVDSELKIIRQKNRKKQDKFKWLLTEVCPANILPEDSSVLITKRIERPEKPERQRHERTRPKPRKVLRTYIEEPDEIEYIQRRSGRNRKQISYKFEEFDSAINSAISEEVEQKKIAIAQGDHIVYGQSRGKDMSTIEAAHWEEEEMARKERNARKRKKKLNDLDATSDEGEEDNESDDEFKVQNDSCSDEDFVAEDDEPSVTEEEEEEEEFSGQSDSGSEYGSKKTKRPNKRRGRRKDEGPVRRSSRNLGKERLLYHDTSSSESDEERPRDAWRMNPIITARRQRSDEDDNQWDRRRRRTHESSSDSGKDPSYGAVKKKRSHSTKSDLYQRNRKRRKQQSSSSEDYEEDGYVQPKRKFRIDSDESCESESEVNKEIDGDTVGKDHRSELQKKTVKKTLRGMHTRVDYRKMADGSSSEDEGGSTGDQRREDEQDLEGGDVKVGSSEKTLVSENVRTGAKLNQNNSALVDDDSLSPISDIEDLKENDVPQPGKVAAIAMEKADKKSAEDDDDDDLEGVTDIFDYLSKD